VELSFERVELGLREPFRIARGVQHRFEVVEVAITSGRHTGFGEATPDARFGQDPDTVCAYLDRAGDALGHDPFALDAIHARLAAVGGQSAAVAAIDAALHDLCGKLAGVSVTRLLGVSADAPATAFTISLDEPDAMARSAERAASRGMDRLKLKLGGGDGLDTARVAAVRGVFTGPLQVDVNEHWDLPEALDTIPRLAGLDVEFVEQPLPAGHRDGAALKARADLPVFVDEDCETLADVARCAEIANGINIKLAKAGGIREAVRMVHAARALGLGVMVGCMGESSLGIAAACPVASLCDHVDLDGNLLLSADPWAGVAFTPAGAQRPSGRPGLGVWRVG
jgi:L-alanine-DL-glutamate epimerase-like enolase superfamily enzyme